MPIQAPQWTDYLNCPVCCREFGAPHRSPISLGCGHTLCRHCLNHLHKKQCPFDQTVIPLEPDELVVNTALLQLAGYPPPEQPQHPPAIKALPEADRAAYDVIVKCLEYLAVCLKYNGNCEYTAANQPTSRLSRPMQRKLVTLLQCAFLDEDGRGRAARAARSLGERTVTELILQHQNPQQISAYLWAAVRSRGCQFLGPAMQEEVLKLVLLALEDGSALSRKVLVMFVVQRLKPHFPQASKTSIGHVVQLLYRASCFKVSKRECDSSLMQLKEEFRTYESLRREHDAQIVQIAIESGLRIAPDQWSALLYGDTAHKSHMQSIIDKLQTPQSFAQSVQELFIALQRTGDPAQLVVISMNLERLASIDASPDAKSPSWQQLAEIMTSLQTVIMGLFHHLQQQAAGRDSNHNHKTDRNSDPSSSQTSPQTVAATPTYNFDASTTRQLVLNNASNFPHPDEESDSSLWVPAPHYVMYPINQAQMTQGLVPLVPMMPRLPMSNLPPMNARPLPPPPQHAPSVPMGIPHAMNVPPPMYRYSYHNTAPNATTLQQKRDASAVKPDKRLYQRSFNSESQQIGSQTIQPNNLLSPYTPDSSYTMPASLPSQQELVENRQFNLEGSQLHSAAPAWQQPDTFTFDHLYNELPALPSTSKNIYHPARWRHVAMRNVMGSNRADDNELEEELQALEQRIYTEFRNAD